MSRNPKSIIQKMIGHVKLQMSGSWAADAKHVGQFLKIPSTQ